MIDITLVPPAYILDVWPRVSGMIQRALDRSTSERDALPVVLDRLMGGQLQLWVVFDGDDILSAATTYVSQRLTYSVFVISSCGGIRMGEWLERGIGILERCARDLGCKEMVLYGRKGWGRALGWMPGRTSFVKELTHD